MKELFAHEFQNNLFGGKFLISALLMVITFLISLGMMHQEYDARVDNYEASISMSGRDYFWDKTMFWADENNQSSSDTITLPMGVVKKPEPLLFISRGMDKQMRKSVEFMATFPIIDFTIKPDQEMNLLKTFFAAPDLLFIMKVLVSLLALLYGFDLICAEREKGTLKLLVVYSKSRTSIFAGKFFGALASIWLAFTVAYLVYVLALVTFVPLASQGEAALRLLFVYLTGLLHIAVFFSIGATISTFFRESAPSLIVSLFVWLILVFALPGLSSLLAQQFVPVDSNQKVGRMKLEKAQQMESDYGAANPDDNNISNTGGYGQRHDAIRENVTAEMQKIDDEQIRKKEHQAELTTNLARITPIGSLTYLYSSLSNSGLEDVKLYREDINLMKTMINDHVTEMLTDPEFGRLYMSSGFDIPIELKEPAFAMFDIGQTQGFRHLDFENSQKTAWQDYLLLALFAIMPAAVAFFRFMSYDPR
jgi:ABC-type transport system involved in multi-copper enzyme maturation permease subunit